MLRKASLWPMLPSTPLDQAETRRSTPYRNPGSGPLATASPLNLPPPPPSSLGPCYNLKPSPRAALQWAKSHQSLTDIVGQEPTTHPHLPSHPQRGQDFHLLSEHHLCLFQSLVTGMWDANTCLDVVVGSPGNFNWLTSIPHWTLPCHGNIYHNFWNPFAGFRAALCDSEQPQ